MTDDKDARPESQEPVGDREAPHLFDQTNGIYERFAEKNHDDDEGDDGDMSRFAGLGGNSGT